MSSFFEKLIGEDTESSQAPNQEKPKKSATKKNPVKKAVKSKPVELEEDFEDFEEKEQEPKPEIVEEKDEEPKPQKPADLVKKIMPQAEGQLAIDVFQTEDEIIVRSAIAGVKPEDLQVLIENGMVKISGQREESGTIRKNDFVLQECYWGSFSRQFVLPTEVDSSRAQANMKDGILTIKIPRIIKERTTRLQVK